MENAAARHLPPSAVAVAGTVPAAVAAVASVAAVAAVAVWVPAEVPSTVAGQAVRISSKAAHGGCQNGRGVCRCDDGGHGYSKVDGCATTKHWSTNSGSTVGSI